MNARGIPLTQIVGSRSAALVAADDRSGGWGNVSDAIARATYQALQLIGKVSSGRILHIEPFSDTLSQTLRRMGLTGEQSVMTRHPVRLAPNTPNPYHRVISYDWLNELDRSIDTTEKIKEANVAQIGQFDAVIVHNLLRIVSQQQLSKILRWLSAFVEPYGFLCVSEPTPPFRIEQFEPILADAELLLASDEQRVEDTWTCSIATFQRRSRDESRLVQVVQRVTLSDVERMRSLRQGLVTTYRDVFGGEEWQEWMRCERPGCGRQYSRASAAKQCPNGYCVCGWDVPLRPFHTLQSVMTQLRDELANQDQSCCYVRPNLRGGIDGFAWGFLSDSHELVEKLIPSTPNYAISSREQSKLHAAIKNHLVETGGDENCVYYHSELGVLEGTRSLSLTRALFQRTLQFALARGARAILLRTSPRSNVYRLLTGLGMRILYSYDTAQPSLVGNETASYTLRGEPDQRVVLGGDIVALLRIFIESDRRLALRIAHGLRQQRYRGANVQ